MFHVGEADTIAFRVSRGDFKAFTIPLAKESLRRKVDAYRSALALHTPNHLPLGHDLYRFLLDPVLQGSPPQARLVFIADDVLHHVPFAALRTRPGEGGHYLVEERAISYLPSVGMLWPANRSAPPGDVLLAMGDPAVQDDEEAQWLATHLGFRPEDGMELKRLPATASEVEGISTRFPKVLRYERGDATKAQFMNEAPRAGVIHLAVPCRIDDAVPFDSAMALAYAEKEQGGIVKAAEVFDLNLNANLVVLSACQRGPSHLGRGQGVGGLASPFLYAGSASVLTSLWRDANGASSRLMPAFYRHYLGGADKAHALRQAQIELLKSTDHAHPSHWAPFILVGDWRKP
jgi:CHAT domain-containing protein